MSRWLRVFARSEKQPAPDVVAAHLRLLGVEGEVRFRGDDDGWTAAEFSLAEGTSPLVLECFLASEKGVRADLNAWAAELETCDYSPHHLSLMEHVVQTRQWYTLRRPVDHADESRLENICESLCRHIAGATDGMYQVDGAGFFAADGTLLLQEY